MKNVILLIGLIIVLASCVHNKVITGTIKKAYSGDRFEIVTKENKTVKCKLAGYTAPSMTTPEGRQARSEIAIYTFYPCEFRVARRDTAGYLSGYLRVHPTRTSNQDIHGKYRDK